MGHCLQWHTLVLSGMTAFNEIWAQASLQIRSIWLPIKLKLLFPANTLQLTTTASPVHVQNSKRKRDPRSRHVQTAAPTKLWTEAADRHTTRRPWTCISVFPWRKDLCDIVESVRVLSIMSLCSSQTLKHTGLGVTPLKPKAEKWQNRMHEWGSMSGICGRTKSEER